MITVSQEFQEALENGDRNYLVKVDITLADSTVLSTITKDDLIELSIEDAVSQDNKFAALGGAVINKATVIINNTDESYSAYNFNGAIVTIKIGLQINGNSEYIDRGVYIVDNASPKGIGLELSCLDYMSKFDKSYTESEIVYPATIKAVIDDACLKCGVLFTGDYPDSTYELIIRPSVSTFREVLSAIGQITGTFVHINRQGELYFSWFNKYLLDNVSGKNLLPHPYQDGSSKTSYNITFTDDGNGSVTAVGIRSENDAFSSFGFANSYNGDGLSKAGLIDGKTYILNGCPPGGSRTTYHICLIENPGYTQFYDIGSGVSFTYHETSNYSVIAYIRVAGEFNLIFNPSIKLIEDGHVENVAYIEDVIDITTSQDNTNIAGVRCYIINEESGVTYEAHYPDTLIDSDFCLDITNNPFIQGSNVQEIVNRVGKRVCGLTIKQLNSKHINNPLYEAGDVGLMLYNTKNNIYNYCPFVFTRTNFCINKPQETVCGIETLLENQANRYKDVQSIKGITQTALITANKAKNDADEAKTDANEAKTISNNARKVATNYLSADTTGIMIADLADGVQTPSTATGRNVKIDNTSVYIRNGQTVLARFGDVVIIGKTDESHQELDYHSLQLINKEQSTYFHVSDLRNKENTYTAKEVFNELKYASDGYIEVGMDITTLKSVLINNVERIQDATVDATFPNRILLTGLNESDSASIEYVTQTEDAVAFTFGHRQDNIGGLSFTHGWYCAASGYASFAEGIRSEASGYASHAQGSGSIANGYTAHAEGYDTTASGYASHAEGYDTTASGHMAHAEGRSTVASDYYSHAEGYDTTASGYASHAEGTSTVASGNYSHASGWNTAASSFAQTVIGSYNIIDNNSNYIFIIGNGNSDNARSNAFTVDWDGNVNIPSNASYQIGGVSLDNRYVKKAGDTMTGNLTIRRSSSGETGFYFNRTDTEISGFVGVGSGGTNHGVWSNKLGKWLIYGDASKVYVAGMDFTNAASVRSSIGAVNKAGDTITGKLTLSGGLSMTTSAHVANPPFYLTLTQSFGDGGAVGYVSKAEMKKNMIGWTQIAQVTGTNSATYSLSGYTECLLMIWHGTNYLGTAVFPTSSIGSTQYEMYTGGWGNHNTASNRAACAKVSNTKLTGVMVRVDNTDVTSSSYFRLYAR